MAGAGLLLCALIGCGQTARLDGAGIEATIRSRLADDLDLPVSSVSCPGGIEVAAGDRFTCRATTPGGVVDVAVHQTDGEGTLVVEPAEAVLVTDRVVDDIVATLADRFDRADAEVTCPGPEVRIEEIDATFTCRARDGDESRIVEVRVRDARGALAYTLRDPAEDGSGQGEPTGAPVASPASFAEVGRADRSVNEATVPAMTRSRPASLAA